MNYIYTTKGDEKFKNNCNVLEKLEQEYLKRINETKSVKEHKTAKVNSAMSADKFPL